jgi:O-antigen/teichoic acid export membrane protein
MTVAGIIIARAFGPGGKGIYAYATTVLALALTVSSGQSSAISWQYGRLKIASSTVYAAMLRFMGIVIVPLALALAIVGFVRRDPGLWAAALVLPFAYLNQTTLAFFMSDGKVRWANIQGSLVPGFFLAAICVVAFVFHAGMIAVLIVWIVAYALVSVRSVAAVAPYRLRPRGEANIWETFRQQAGFAAKASLNQLMQALNFQIDLFIILYALGAKSLGVYSVAVGIGQLMWYISRPLAVSSYGPVTSGTKSEAAYLTIVCLRHAIAMVGAACIFLFFAGPYLIELLYGGRFSGAGLAMRWILPGIVAYCALPFFGQFFVLQLGRPSIMIVSAGISTVLCAAVTLALISRFGIVAGSIGTSISYLGSFAFMAIVFQRETKISPLAIFAYSRKDIGHYVELMRAAAGKIARMLQWRAT